jgi:hypothetical protein
VEDYSYRLLWCGFVEMVNEHCKTKQYANHRVKSILLGMNDAAKLMDWPELREYQEWANKLERDRRARRPRDMRERLQQLMEDRYPCEQTLFARLIKMRDLMKNLRVTIADYYYPSNRGYGVTSKECRFVVATGGCVNEFSDDGWCHFHPRDGGGSEGGPRYGDPHASSITKNKLSAHMRITTDGLFEISTRFHEDLSDW